MEVRAILRAIDVLRYIGDARSGASLTDIACSVGLSKATTHRVLQTLQSRKIVACDEQSGRHYLGPEFFRLASKPDRYESLKRIADPFLKSLRDETAETVTLVVREHDERLTIDVYLSPHELKAAPAIGSKKPIHSGAAGKALLMHLGDGELVDLAARTGLPQLTPRTITSRAELKRDLSRAKVLGYAKSIEETVIGEGAVAVPLRVGGQSIAAVNVCGPAFRVKGKQLQSIVKATKTAANSIAAALATPANATPARKLLRRT